MARATKIISILPQLDGKVEVSYLSGPAPLPALGQTGSFVFHSQDQIEREIKDLQASMSDYQLLLLQMAVKWLKSDGTFGPVVAVTGTTLTLDVTAAQVLKVQ